MPLLLLCVSFASLLTPVLKLLALAQPIQGFISIDCGAPDAYSDPTTKIYYQTDEGFTAYGKSNRVSTEHFYEDYVEQSKNLRYFPNGMRNCYTLKPEGGKNTMYLIRAYFWYGNYDGKNVTPTFDLYIDVNYWTTIDYSDNGNQEIMYVSKADYIQVCLVNTRSGIPYISALELRVLNNSIYRIESGFLKRVRRYDIGPSSLLQKQMRYKNLANTSCTMIKDVDA